jgi:hypothetical protein
MNIGQPARVVLTTRFTGPVTFHQNPNVVRPAPGDFTGQPQPAPPTVPCVPTTPSFPPDSSLAPGPAIAPAVAQNSGDASQAPNIITGPSHLPTDRSGTSPDVTESDLLGRGQPDRLIVVAGDFSPGPSATWYNLVTVLDPASNPPALVDQALPPEAIEKIARDLAEQDAVRQQHPDLVAFVSEAMFPEDRIDITFGSDTDE